jgi:hypothetical protein
VLVASCYCLLRFLHLQIYITLASMNSRACGCIITRNFYNITPEKTKILILRVQGDSHFCCTSSCFLFRFLKNAGGAVSGTHPLRRIRQRRFVTVSIVCGNETVVSNECHFCRGISFVFTNCQQRSVILVGRSLVLWLCGHSGLRCGAYARSSTRFSTRIVCDHCNFGETRLV